MNDRSLRGWRSPLTDIQLCTLSTRHSLPATNGFNGSSMVADCVFRTVCIPAATVATACLRYTEREIAICFQINGRFSFGGATSESKNAKRNAKLWQFGSWETLCVLTTYWINEYGVFYWYFIAGITLQAVYYPVVLAGTGWPSRGLIAKKS